MKRPDNIVLIVSDQHRAGWMGCAGNRAVRTPNLDALAQDGVRFTDAYCNAPLCVPPRMSMLAGRQPSRTGVYFNGSSLPSDVPTFAHALSLAGYETVLCGRMHFSGADQRHGFQHRLVGDITPSYPGGPKTTYGHLQGTAGQGMRSIEHARPGDSPVLRYDDAVVEGCEAYVADRVHRTVEQPLFLTVGLYGPHHPFICPPELYDDALAAVDAAEPPLSLDPDPRHPWVEDWFQRLQADRITPDQMRIARANYAGLVNRLDQLVGRIVTAARALSGETLVIYLSDHGEMAGDRGMFWKQSFFEGAVRVPFIWSSLSEPSGDPTIARGRTVDVPASLIDLAPTLTGMAGAPPMPGLDGGDLSPLLMTATEPVDHDRWRQRPVFAEGIIAGSPVRMIRQGDHKLIYYHDHPPPQLFDLASDPHEQHDLGQSDTHAARREDLLQQLMTGWDPARIKRAGEAKQADEHYLTRWGEEVGMGLGELWESFGAGAELAAKRR